MSDRALIEQLDQAIDALLAGAQTPGEDSELSALMEIAGKGFTKQGKFVTWR